MTLMRPLFPFLAVFFLFFTAGESEAVIYRYVNEKGVPTFADDLQKVPEQHRASAVIVSGVAVDEAAEAEKARLAAESRVRPERQESVPQSAGEPVGRRFIRSGIAVGIFAALLFVLANIHGLREQARLLFRIRAALVLLLFLFLGITHATDIAGLFGKAGETVKSPIAGMQEQSAERGRKAADAYKAMDRVLEQRMNEEDARLKEMEKKFDEAEKGK